MYLQNKYTKCYYSIIDRAKSRDLPKEIYTERHHILPKSLGGANGKDNLVKLTAKEHRLALITPHDYQSCTYKKYVVCIMDDVKN